MTSVTDATVRAPTTETTVLYADPAQLDDALRVQSALSGLAVVGYDPGLTSAGTPGTGAGSSSTDNTIDVGSPLPGQELPDVVLVTGSNFSVNPPTSTPVPTTAPGSSTSAGSTTSSTTTVPGPLANNPHLSAPSGATEKLEPWDPRSCTANGGAGP